MRFIKKSVFPFMLALIHLVLLCIPGCSSINHSSPLPPVTYEGYVTLEVLLDNDTTIMFDNALNDSIQKLKQTYSNVAVEVLRFDEYIENYESFDAMREDIRLGKGPDIFILNTDNFPGYSMERVLFPDVNQAMREGLFANLNMYYDYDSELNTAGLLQEVMDAGVVDGFRYTLPLTYDYPVMFVDKDRLEDAGLDGNIFDGGIISVMDALVELGDPQQAKSANFYEQRYLFNFFPELVDYDTGHVTLDRDEMITFLKSFLAFKQVKGFGPATDDNSLPTQFYGISTSPMHKIDTWMTEGLCMRAGWSLGDVIAETALAAYSKMDMEIYPLTGSDGQIVAEVRQYAAINHSCENVRLAYELIRDLLTENGQWYQSEYGRVTCWDGSTSRNPVTMLGYPVRVKKSVNPLFTQITSDVVLGFAALGIGESGQLALQKLRDTNLNDKDIPILQEKIDVVRYPTAGIEWQFAMDIVQEFEQNGWDPEAVDIETAVETLISELEVYMWTE